MNEETISNITLHYDSKTTIIKDNGATVSNDEKFKITIIIDNITQYHFKCYKMTITSKEEDMLITIFSEVTRISCNILIPGDKKGLVIINDSFW